MHIKRLMTAAILAIGLAGTTNAATVAVGGTGTTGAGGITFFNGSPTTDFVGQPSVWTNAAMIEAATWVQSGGGATNVFRFDFDLTGFDISTASITVDWAIDNEGTLDLNGSQIDAIAFGGAAYSTVHSVTVSNPSAFLAGQNTLLFNHAGDQASDGLRAAVRVTADTAPVPLPASGLLLVAALGGAALLRRKR
ncbi:MAG: VPLPA-CTERM sorting domain-containing protein [Pseudomonadota bacterium]